MSFTFKKNNKQTKKPVNCLLQDDASAGIQSLQTRIKINSAKTHGTEYRRGHFICLFVIASLPSRKLESI